jgi:phage terminase large subunit-like protein
LGEFSVELDNVLWKPEVFRHVPADPKILTRQCNRVVVAVDPSGASGSEDKRSDEIGIIVAGRHRAGYVVLADRTMRGSPQEWARAAVKAYAEFQADAIVAERNFGGAMVADNIRAVAGPGVSIREVTASRSKHVRAEPISSLYAKGLVEHVARVTADGNVIGLEELEAQCCNMTTSGFMGDRSPDRLDAMVWALSDLAFAPPKNRVMVFNGAW